jgi:glucokinase
VNAGETSQKVAVIALDIGGTNLKGSLVNDSGEPFLVATIDTEVTGAPLVERVRKFIVALNKRSVEMGSEVVGVGICCPGIIDSDSGVIRFASSLNWSNVELGSLVSQDLGVPVSVNHDVRSAGLAESFFGDGPEKDDFVFIAIGTGVAAAIVSAGATFSGSANGAGELGHIPVVPGGELCTCGQRGCLEVYISGAGLSRRYLAQGGMVPLTAEEISQRLDTDPIAACVWEDAVAALNTGLTVMTLLIDPRYFVLGGGVSRAGEALFATLRLRLHDSLVWRDAPFIVGSQLGSAGGRVGAAVQAFRAAGKGAVAHQWSLETVLDETASQREILL